MTTDKQSRHREGEAIAGIALQELGVRWRISYRGDRNHWEVRNVLDKDLIFATYGYSESEGWQYKPNPAASGPIKSNIDWAIQKGFRAIAPQSQEVK